MIFCIPCEKVERSQLHMHIMLSYLMNRLDCHAQFIDLAFRPTLVFANIQFVKLLPSFPGEGTSNNSMPHSDYHHTV